LRLLTKILTGTIVAIILIGMTEADYLRVCMLVDVVVDRVVWKEERSTLVPLRPPA